MQEVPLCFWGVKTRLYYSGAEVKEGRWKNGILALMDLVAAFFAYVLRVSPVTALTDTVA
jgi:hypothetical protein